MIQNRLFGAALILLTLLCSPVLHAQEQKPADVAGKWKWSFTRPDGQTIESVLELKQDARKITGVSTLSTGEKHEITNGSVDGNTVSFDITREREGRKVTAKYSGKLEGDAIKGTVETGAANQAKVPWEARRVKEQK